MKVFNLFSFIYNICGWPLVKVFALHRLDAIGDDFDSNDFCLFICEYLLIDCWILVSVLGWLSCAVCSRTYDDDQWGVVYTQECATWPQFFFPSSNAVLCFLLLVRMKTVLGGVCRFYNEQTPNSIIVRAAFCLCFAWKKKSQRNHSKNDSEKVSNGIGRTDILTNRKMKKNCILANRKWS